MTDIQPPKMMADGTVEKLNAMPTYVMDAVLKSTRKHDEGMLPDEHFTILICSKVDGDGRIKIVLPSAQAVDLAEHIKTYAFMSREALETADPETETKH